MAKNHHFDNIPSPRLMLTIGATALKPAEAVAELIANSLDARVDDSPVRVDVTLGDGQLTVVDDATGMTLDVLKKAVQLGIDMNIITGRRTPRMGTYGLGMKTAAASLGDQWGIVTRPVGRPGIEYRVRFDLKEYGRRGQAASQDWSVDVVEDEPDVSGPLGERDHGTAIWMSHLRDKDLLPGAFLDYLGRAYSPYIVDRHDRIFVNGDEASPEPYNIVEGTKYDFDDLVVEGQPWRVRGWVGLDKRTHNQGDYGINLYREGQLIESWNKDFFKAHLMTSRIMGVAHLDFVPVNFNKRGFETPSEEWKYARAKMKAILAPAVDGSRTMSRGRDDDTRVHRAISRMRIALGTNGGGVNSDGDGAAQLTNQGEDSPGVAPSGPSMQPRVTARRNTVTLPRGSVTVDCTTDELADEKLPWDYVYDVDRLEMLVVLNTSAVVFKKTTDVEFLGCLAIADCIARMLQESEGVDARRAHRVRDEWLHDALAGEYTPVTRAPSRKRPGDSQSGAEA